MIYKDELKDAIYRAEESGIIMTIADVISIIDETSIIDAVPVIRCKDCVEWESDWGEDSLGRHWCPVVDRWTVPQWFCADGERRRDVNE